MHWLSYWLWCHQWCWPHPPPLRLRRWPLWHVNRRGLVVLGFPSNDFLQEKSDNTEIAEFCYNTYGVIFPMFARSAVRGSDANPFYKQLAQITGKVPSWNFNKYLIDRSGRSVTHYASTVEPDNKAFVEQLEKLLATP